MTYQWTIYHIQKDSWSLDAWNPPTSQRCVKTTHEPSNDENRNGKSNQITTRATKDITFTENSPSGDISSQLSPPPSPSPLSLSLTPGHHLITTIIIIIRPKPAYNRQGLGWDHGARIQFGQLHFGVFSTSRFAPVIFTCEVMMERDKHTDRCKTSRFDTKYSFSWHINTHT